jgi:SAM-dependent methyltransferase
MPTNMPPAGTQQPKGRSKGLFPRLARAARKLAKRAAPRNGASAPKARSARDPYPDQFRVTPTPRKIAPDWPDPPVVDAPNDRVRYFPTFVRNETHSFDIELFEKLNAEYESKPIWPIPPKYDTATIAARTRKSLLEVHGAIGLADKRVLEIGCGTGYNVWFLGHHFGAEATGIDVAERNTWKALSDEKTKFVWADITDANPLPEKHFDRIISFAVWEHITHPYRALQEVYRMLKPGGLVWMNANLYRGPVASHLYREIKFPWPHLLFSDEVIKEFYRRKGMKERGAAWVNKLTWAQYEQYFKQIGFELKMVKFTGRPFDHDLYKRFEDYLNRYPLFDLQKDFFTAVLERPLDS